MSEQEQKPRFSALEKKVLEFLQEGEGDFAGLMMEAHAFQKAHGAAYGALCATLPEATNWREIPALPLDAFRSTAIRTFPEGETVRTFRTSGTTGEGYGEHHFRTLALYRAAVFGGWGLPLRGVLSLTASPVEAPYSSLSCMAGYLTMPDKFFNGDWPKLRQALKEEKKSVILFGTALGFLNFFEWLGERAMVLPAGSKAVETGGYKGTDRVLPKAELYQMFSERLGLDAEQVWNEYGMTELSSQFYTKGLGEPHRGGDWVRGVVIDPETNREVEDGGTGVLRIFDLANLGSCCAIQTRDLAIRRGEDFELIGRDPAALPRGCSRAADEMLGERGVRNAE